MFLLCVTVLLENILMDLPVWIQPVWWTLDDNFSSPSCWEATQSMMVPPAYMTVEIIFLSVEPYLIFD